MHPCGIRAFDLSGCVSDRLVVLAHGQFASSRIFDRHINTAAADNDTVVCRGNIVAVKIKRQILRDKRRISGVCRHIIKKLDRAVSRHSRNRRLERGILRRADLGDAAELCGMGAHEITLDPVAVSRMHSRSVVVVHRPADVRDGSSSTAGHAAAEGVAGNDDRVAGLVIIRNESEQSAALAGGRIRARHGRGAGAIRKRKGTGNVISVVAVIRSADDAARSVESLHGAAHAHVVDRGGAEGVADQRARRVAVFKINVDVGQVHILDDRAVADRAEQAVNGVVIRIGRRQRVTVAAQAADSVALTVERTREVGIGA